MAVIENPSNGLKAGVGLSERLNVSASSNPRDYYSSRDDGKLFNFVSGFDATTGNICISIENDSTTDDLYLGYARISCLTNCSFDFYFTESGDTPAGTTLTAVNMNAKSSKPAEVKAFGNAAVTGITNTTTGKFLHTKTSAYTDDFIELQGLILGRGHGINIAVTGNGEVDVTIEGHLEVPPKQAE